MSGTVRLVKKIVTHVKPHLDELVAIWLLVRWGEKHFPGINTVPVEVWRKGLESADGRSFEEHEDEGTMFIGIGGGQFDEHPTNGTDDLSGECAATLVAKRLGIQDDPALERILDFVRRIDTKGGANPWDISAVVKAANEVGKGLPELLTWVFLALDAKYEQQVKFLEAEADANIAQWDTVGSVRVATAESDNQQVYKVLFTRGAAVAIVRRRQDGRVAIFTQKRDNIRLTDAVRIIRLLEQKARGDVRTTNWKELAAPGSIDAVARWYYLKEGEMLLNGSDTHPDTPATGLSLSTIRQAVILALSGEMICSQANVCDGKSCKWYQLGLSRCQTIRYRMSSGQSQ